MPNQPATRKDIEDVLANLHQLTRQATDKLAQIDSRLEKLESKVDIMNKIDNKLELIDNRLDKTCIDITDMKTSHDRLHNTIERLTKSVDKYETEREEENR